MPQSACVTSSKRCSTTSSSSEPAPFRDFVDHCHHQSYHGDDDQPYAHVQVKEFHEDQPCQHPVVSIGVGDHVSLGSSSWNYCNDDDGGTRSCPSKPGRSYHGMGGATARPCSTNSERLLVPAKLARRNRRRCTGEDEERDAAASTTSLTAGSGMSYFTGAGALPMPQGHGDQIWSSQLSERPSRHPSLRPGDERFGSRCSAPDGVGGPLSRVHMGPMTTGDEVRGHGNSLAPDSPGDEVSPAVDAGERSGMHCSSGEPIRCDPSCSLLIPLPGGDASAASAPSGEATPQACRCNRMREKRRYRAAKGLGIFSLASAAFSAPGRQKEGDTASTAAGAAKATVKQCSHQSSVSRLRPTRLMHGRRRGFGAAAVEAIRCRLNNAAYSCLGGGPGYSLMSGPSTGVGVGLATQMVAAAQVEAAACGRTQRPTAAESGDGATAAADVAESEALFLMLPSPMCSVRAASPIATTRSSSECTVPTSRASLVATEQRLGGGLRERRRGSANQPGTMAAARLAFPPPLDDEVVGIKAVASPQKATPSGTVPRSSYWGAIVAAATFVGGAFNSAPAVISVTAGTPPPTAPPPPPPVVQPPLSGPRGMSVSLSSSANPPTPLISSYSIRSIVDIAPFFDAAIQQIIMECERRVACATRPTSGAPRAVDISDAQPASEPTESVLMLSAPVSPSRRQVDCDSAAHASHRRPSPLRPMALRFHHSASRGNLEGGSVHGSVVSTQSFNTPLFAQQQPFPMTLSLSPSQMLTTPVASPSSTNLRKRGPVSAARSSAGNLPGRGRQAYALYSLGKHSERPPAPLTGTEDSLKDEIAADRDTLVTVQQLIENIAHSVPYGSAAPMVFIAALIYLSRITLHRDRDDADTSVTAVNWPRLTILAVMVASKMYVDHVHRLNKRFAAAAGMSLEELGKLELDFLYLIDFDLLVDEAEVERWADWMESVASRRNMITPLKTFVMGRPPSLTTTPRSSHQPTFGVNASPFPHASHGAHHQHHPHHNSHYLPGSHCYAQPASVQLSQLEGVPVTPFSWSTSGHPLDGEAGYGTGGSNSVFLGPKMAPGLVMGPNAAPLTSAFGLSPMAIGTAFPHPASVMGRSRGETPVSVMRATPVTTATGWGGNHAYVLGGSCAAAGPAGITSRGGMAVSPSSSLASGVPPPPPHHTGHVAVRESPGRHTYPTAPCGRCHSPMPMVAPPWSMSPFSTPPFVFLPSSAAAGSKAALFHLCHEREDGGAPARDEWHGGQCRVPPSAGRLCWADTSGNASTVDLPLACHSASISPSEASASPRQSRLFSVVHAQREPDSPMTTGSVQRRSCSNELLPLRPPSRGSSSPLGFFLRPLLGKRGAPTATTAAKKTVNSSRCPATAPTSPPPPVLPLKSPSEPVTMESADGLGYVVHNEDVATTGKLPPGAGAGMAAAGDTEPPPSAATSQAAPQTEGKPKGIIGGLSVAQVLQELRQNILARATGSIGAANDYIVVNGADSFRIQGDADCDQQIGEADSETAGTSGETNANGDGHRLDSDNFEGVARKPQSGVMRSLGAQDAPATTLPGESAGWRTTTGARSSGSQAVTARGSQRYEPALRLDQSLSGSRRAPDMEGPASVQTAPCDPGAVTERSGGPWHRTTSPGEEEFAWGDAAGSQDNAYLECVNCDMGQLGCDCGRGGRRGDMEEQEGDTRIEESDSRDGHGDGNYCSAAESDLSVVPNTFTSCGEDCGSRLRLPREAECSSKSDSPCSTSGGGGGGVAEVMSVLEELRLMNRGAALAAADRTSDEGRMPATMDGATRDLAANVTAAPPPMRASRPIAIPCTKPLDADHLYDALERGCSRHSARSEEKQPSGPASVDSGTRSVGSGRGLASAAAQAGWRIGSTIGNIQVVKQVRDVLGATTTLVCGPLNVFGTTRGERQQRPRRGTQPPQSGPVPCSSRVATAALPSYPSPQSPPSPPTPSGPYRRQRCHGPFSRSATSSEGHTERYGDLDVGEDSAPREARNSDSALTYDFCRGYATRSVESCSTVNHRTLGSAVTQPWANSFDLSFDGTVRMWEGDDGPDDAEPGYLRPYTRLRRPVHSPPCLS